jgi:hypothetical protein
VAQGAIYTDSYFRYLFILMKWGAEVQRRRIRVKIFLFLQYERVKLAILNDKKRNRLVMFVYYKEAEDKAQYEFIGQINIFGYYPKQVRKILFGLQKRIRENTDGYRDRLKEKNITISRAVSWNYKRRNKWT